MVDNVVKAFGGIDIVVSNAGTHLPGRLEDIDGDAMLEHFKTKVLGAWQLARSVVPHMRQNEPAASSSSSARPAKCRRQTSSPRP